MTNTAVSLFAGVGGFDLALERNGVKVVASVEIEKKAQEVLRQHFPASTIFGDITGVTGEQLIQAGFNPIGGIITGGFPCQDLSVAGKRAGLEGERSGLFWEICRILDETRAENFILENVAGLLSSNNGTDMATVIEALAERGYGVAYRVLDAQYFGVPQRRRRVFIVGSLGDDGRTSAEILAIGESRSRDFETGNNTRKATPKTIRKSSGISSETIVGTLQARDYKGVGNQYVEENKIVIVDGTRVNDVRVTDDGIVPTVTARFGTGGNNVPLVFEPKSAFEENWAESEVKNALRANASKSSHVVIETFENNVPNIFPIQGTVIGRADSSGPQGKGYSEDETMFTLTKTDVHAIAFQAFDTFNQTVSKTSQTIKSHSANNENIGTVFYESVVGTLQSRDYKGLNHEGARDGKAIIQNSIVRRLTPVECERLQGFPDDWTAGQTDGHRYKQMGNAVAVPVVEFIVKNMIKKLCDTP